MDLAEYTSHRLAVVLLLTVKHLIQGGPEVLTETETALRGNKLLAHYIFAKRSVLLMPSLCADVASLCKLLIFCIMQKSCSIIRPVRCSNVVVWVIHAWHVKVM